MKVSVIDFVKLLFLNEEGLTVVEYVMAAALLVAVVSSVFYALEVGLTSKFNESMNNIGKE
ncbi:Flp family type IVb pilin [Vibrio breoganii]